VEPEGDAQRAPRIMNPRIAGIACACLIACCPPALAGPADAVPPQIEGKGRYDYSIFAASTVHRAFAIAPGGTWGWKADAESREQAGEAALAACQGHTVQRCVLYAVDDDVVFDAKTWPTLWGPYKTRDEAGKAATGRGRGERFPDLQFRDGTGKTMKLSSLRGKVVVLHFWASWCGPCRTEMPDLQALGEALRDRSDVAFVLLQVRESFDVARQWAAKQGLRLPLFDSGSGGESDDAFTLADGGKLRDREIANRFPTTYVLDKHGVVLFSHVGPVARWAEYGAFIRDAALKSGR
jgi:thiol-disulfide isomerase/thioredoxin